MQRVRASPAAYGLFTVGPNEAAPLAPPIHQSDPAPQANLQSDSGPAAQRS